ncbi:hypothetical protein AVEN_274806-1 [Araneus ventricosus]|uniref:Mutator-like transposase domain-containing protein n=1 Tax=Araneus ventricosus TaxID=182803 RepID=A0A4Y2TDL8_ARAVE|nr:hypothetical protein AVEN_274806-1 [Araneus ventricosus]
MCCSHIVCSNELTTPTYRSSKSFCSTRNFRYAIYLGDGDSKVFLKIRESKVYEEELVVEILECIGDVLKRMGTRLRNLRNKLMSTKRSDGKNISGRGRLTDAQFF